MFCLISFSFSSVQNHLLGGVLFFGLVWFGQDGVFLLLGFSLFVWGAFCKGMNGL